MSSLNLQEIEKRFSNLRVALRSSQTTPDVVLLAQRLLQDTTELLCDDPLAQDGPVASKLREETHALVEEGDLASISEALADHLLVLRWWSSREAER